jgi:tetratricopeptide (TPR) repeat protein
MTTSLLLQRAAFGDEPARWPLPTATGPRERWLRAVAAGGQGRYGAALADLAALSRTADGPICSLAHSTRASFLRQLGDHRRARDGDGRALALAGDDDEARADALTGLAADALGIGRFALAQRLLHRVAAEVSDEEPSRRRVRLGWVSAELAMARGDGAAAAGHARRAVAAAAALGSTRHTVKSEVVLAAALCSAGALDDARAVADAALAAADAAGLVPLRWALACLLTDLGSAVLTAERVAQVRDQSADIVRHRGGAWSAR